MEKTPENQPNYYVMGDVYSIQKQPKIIIVNFFPTIQPITFFRYK